MIKKFRCGFYCEPLRWIIKASTTDEAAQKFAKKVKREKLKSKSGSTNFVVIEI